MIKSMTGFGRGKYEKDGRNYVCEIKSVNHKYSDISIRIPKFFTGYEDLIRRKIAGSISRGKIDVFITFENYSNMGNSIHFNIELAKEYMNGLQKLASQTGLEEKISLMELIKLPEVLKLEESKDEELLKTEILLAVDEALENFVEMRTAEGQELIKDMEKRIECVEQNVEEIEKYSKNVVLDYKKKLEARVKELLDTSCLDENRLAQEIVIFSDKSSIEEELTRLKSHIVQFKSFMLGTSPIGKKIDFLIQEMNREVNTIGSKANCLEITNLVVELKNEIENIREQVQNIE